VSASEAIPSRSAMSPTRTSSVSTHSAPVVFERSWARRRACRQRSVKPDHTPRNAATTGAQHPVSHRTPAAAELIDSERRSPAAATSAMWPDEEYEGGCWFGLLPAASADGIPGTRHCCSGTNSSTARRRPPIATEAVEFVPNRQLDRGPRRVLLRVSGCRPCLGTRRSAGRRPPAAFRRTGRLVRVDRETAPRAQGRW
jgi:hypothetical protein